MEETSASAEIILLKEKVTSGMNQKNILERGVNKMVKKNRVNR